MSRTGKVRAFFASQTNLVLALWIFLAYVFAHFITYQPSESLRNSGLESLGIAHSIAFSGRFADPFYCLPTGPTAHLAPLYPIFLSAILRIWGEGPAAVLVVKWSAILMAATQAALLPLLSEKLKIGYFPGVIAAIAVLVGGYAVFLWEANLAGLIIQILLFPMLSIFDGKVSAKYLAMIGALWGILLLVSPLPVLVYGAWLAWAWIQKRVQMRQLAVIVLTTLVMVLPWIIRTRIVLGHTVFIRDNLGLELAQMYSDCSQPTAALNGLVHCDALPNGNKDQASLVASMGEIEYNHMRLRQAIHWMVVHPKRTIGLTTKRIVMFWVPNDTWRLADATAGDVVLWIATPLSLVGLVLLYRIHRTAFGIFLLWMVLYPPAYYLVGQGRRARVPILFVTLLPAALLLCRVMENENPFRGLEDESIRTDNQENKIFKQSAPTSQMK